MKDIIEILSELGIKVEDDQKKKVLDAVNTEYKTINEHDKKVKQLESDAENYKKQYEAANEALRKFDGIKPDDVKQMKEDYEKQIKELQETYKKESEQKALEEAVDKELGKLKFSSEYAKKSVKSEIMAAGLKLNGETLIGFNDIIEAVKKNDSTAIVTEEQQNLENKQAKFTTSISGNNNQAGDDISAIRKAMGLPEEKKE